MESCVSSAERYEWCGRWQWERATTLPRPASFGHLRLGARPRNPQTLDGRVVDADRGEATGGAGPSIQLSRAEKP